MHHRPSSYMYLESCDCRTAKFTHPLSEWLPGGYAVTEVS